ncbi:uncharacterized protein MELLADRAFT_104907 [Melampsora larici-populina 98AG31]|uniref:Uncharacterized protein n=1 Tax=Melampsora larici-populina (strain 98AG31 / pathotype 3-4-7) TaxID=747676 RepID=F4RGH3_MELLP|nr:uncharacterized protein MELLADRAFT_104907 [Melampsora larici-populina 98AG31]EGG08648.1 hypothetical protein MELLADRAFT_104907 [Melampsora larici-populina 98AG31]
MRLFNLLKVLYFGTFLLVIVPLTTQRPWLKNEKGKTTIENISKGRQSQVKEVDHRTSKSLVEEVESESSEETGANKFQKISDIIKTKVPVKSHQSTHDPSQASEASKAIEEIDSYT